MWEFVDKVIYINLDHREDRLEIMKKFFADTKIPLDKVIRFSAIKRSFGALGCTESHMGVLKLAKSNGWKNILILEDDLQILNFNEGYRKLEELVALPKWDVIMLTGWYYRHNLPRVYSAGNSGAYLVNEKYIDTLLENRIRTVKQYSNKIYRLAFKSVVNTDVSWYTLQNRHSWYGIEPCLCNQVDGFSDINNSVIKSSQIVGVYDDKIHRTVYK
jgi:glycosyl transferase family 25